MSFNSRILLPVALGMSLVSVTAFVVYYVFKKDEEDKNENLVKTSRINVIEINIPKSIVPALIGRSGSNIKEIERKSGALIHFKKFSDKDYDVCIVRGRSEASQLAETLIHDFIKEQPLIVDDKIEVPGWACGRIIGVGGENINDISHRSGARVKIDGPNLGDRATQRQVSIKGTKEQIEVAKGLIEKCVAQEKCRREIEQSKRSPRHGTPAPDTSDDAPGDTKHAKYKRPAEASGASIEVYVSAVSSPSRFWVQFVGAQVSQLDELVAHMTDYYGSRENRQAHELSQVSVGQVVAAVFRHDGRWYRARVHAILPNEFDATKQCALVALQLTRTASDPRLVYGSLNICPTSSTPPSRSVQPCCFELGFKIVINHTLVVVAVFRHDGRWYRARVHAILPNEFDATKQVADVFFVDYGDSEYVAVNELCELRADLLRLRFQAMECFLAGVKPAGKEADVVGVTAAGATWDKWHPQAIERFEELTQVLATSGTSHGTSRTTV
ncbi:tudor and KH domain-containing protein homolog [Ostrinia nubilalis]|uniref:tudor and KH domain-containing protein homolog n=1 Tax=Ostrinia nubilalis TaxID=29057 RepID=UPI00308251F5